MKKFDSKARKVDVAEENTLHAWLARCVILKIFDSAGVSPLMKMRRQVRKRAGWHDLNNSAVVLYTVRSLLFRGLSLFSGHIHAERALKFLRSSAEQQPLVLLLLLNLWGR